MTKNWQNQTKYILIIDDHIIRDVPYTGVKEHSNIPLISDNVFWWTINSLRNNQNCTKHRVLHLHSESIQMHVIERNYAIVSQLTALHVPAGTWTTVCMLSEWPLAWVSTIVQCSSSICVLNTHYVYVAVSTHVCMFTLTSPAVEYSIFVH